ACRPGFAVELVGEAAAVHELQRKVRAPFRIAHFIDLYDMGMLQAGDGLGFDPEAGQLLGAGMTAHQDHLQGHKAFQVLMAGLVHNAHAAATQLLQNGVVSNVRRSFVYRTRRRWPGRQGSLFRRAPRSSRGPEHLPCGAAHGADIAMSRGGGRSVGPWFPLMALAAGEAYRHETISWRIAQTSRDP